jgi:hypothetical protein
MNRYFAPTGIGASLLVLVPDPTPAPVLPAIPGGPGPALPESAGISQARGEVMEVVRQAFRPEFLNRLDEILPVPSPDASTTPARRGRHHVGIRGRNRLGMKGRLLGIGSQAVEN